LAESGDLEELKIKELKHCTGRHLANPVRSGRKQP
jgi:hypothetical protein